MSEVDRRVADILWDDIMLDVNHKNTEPNDWKILGYCVVGGQVELYFDNDDGHPSGQDISGGTLNLDKELILKMLSDLEGDK